MDSRKLSGKSKRKIMTMIEKEINARRNGMVENTKKKDFSTMKE